MRLRSILTATRLTSLFMLFVLVAYYASGSVLIKSYIPRGFNCNFKNSACGWKNAFRYERIDNFNWKWGSGSDGKQRGSGTNDDRSKGGGYMYIKSRKSMNRTAKLISPYFRAGVASCFKFWYFMKGKTMGHLAVHLARSRSKIKQNSKVLWNLIGHQGNVWKNATIPLPAPTSGVLIFEAFDTELGKSGNILIDEVILTGQGAECRSIYPPYAAPAGVITTTDRTTVASSKATFVSEVSTTDHATSQPMHHNARTTGPKLEDFTTKLMRKDFTTSQTFTSFVTTKQQINKTTTTPAATPTTTIPTNVLFVTTEFTNNMTPSIGKNVASWTSLAMDQTGSGYGDVEVASKTTEVALIAVAVVIVVIIILVVSLVLYFKRRKKQRTPFADNCSVIMTRMYPEITTEQRIDYRKFN